MNDISKQDKAEPINVMSFLCIIRRIDRFKNKWIILLLSCSIMMVSGTKYMFGAYANSFKTILNFEHHHLNMIAMLASIGTYLGFWPGIVNDYCGPRPSILLGAFSLFLGYFLIYVSCMKWIPFLEVTYINWYFEKTSLNVFFVCICYVLIGNGSISCYLATISANIQNFDLKHRGKIIGILTSAYGLSGAIFSFMYGVIFQSHVIPFLLFASISTCIIPLLGMLFIRKITNKKGEVSSQSEKCNRTIGVEVDEKSLLMSRKNQEKKNLYYVPDVMENQQKSMIESEQKLDASHSIQSSYDNDDEGEGDTDLHVVESSSRRETEHVEITLKGRQNKENYDPIKNFHPFQMICTVDYYVMFVLLCFSIGCGLTTINNMGSIVLSYGGRVEDQSIFVFLISVFSCIGRGLFGFLSDRFSHVLSRVGFISVTVLMMTISFYCFSLFPLWSFYIVVPIFAVSYGGTFSLLPTFISERFGPKYFGLNFALSNIGSLVGGYLISVFIASYLYEMNISSLDPRAKMCHGRKCFWLTFMIMTGLCLVSFLTCVLLMLRTRHLYESIHKMKEKLNT